MKLPALLALALCLVQPSRAQEPPAQSLPLWRAYEGLLCGAKYVDLTHTITPAIPVWGGFGPSWFVRTINPRNLRAYTYAEDGFEATGLSFSTDQLGTQLDPPAHWNPDFPAIDELPPTFAVRPLVVISIVEQVRREPGYALQVADVEAWEKTHGRIPEGSVVFVRSDWSRRWPDPKLGTETVFPGVGLAAIKFLHLERKILFHGHEPLDTDTTPNLEGEAWLLQNGYTQAEGVAHLDEAPEAGALVVMGYPKIGGGTGGLARFVAICPPDWPHGVKIDPARESPLPKMERPLRWDEAAGMRRR